jgi:glycerophosphoryl diester phosphodiesterase
MLAFTNAALSGADVLDTDAHLTHDGALVLIHDDTVDRTTDGRGAVRDLTLAQIRGLDAAYRFTLDGGRTFPHRGSGLKVPRLEELLDTFPDRRIGVEIKAESAAARILCDVVRARRSQGRLLVSAVSQETMDAFRGACPEVATSGTEREVRLFYTLSRVGLTGVVTPRYQSLQVPEFSGGRKIVTSRFVAAAHDSGLAVQPWAVDTAEDLRRMRALGVDGVNTDFPDRLLPLFASPAGGPDGR